MSEQRMDVFLLAAPQPGVERSELVRNLAEAFKKDVPSIEKMLRRQRTLIKTDVGQELAAKYKALIEKSGGQCELVNHGEAPAPAANEPPKAQSLTLEPIAPPEDVACYCVKCGSLIRIGQTKCPTCFTPVTEFSRKDKMTAGLLAFFIGGLGVHRLYLGQWWGLAYLFFWWTFIPSIVSFIEAIVFWSTAQETWDKKYGQVPKSGNTAIIIAVVACFLFVPVIGILAAVALPAYQDYTYRAKISSAMPLVIETREKVSAFIKKTKSYPTDNILVGLPENISSDVVESIKLQDGARLEVAYHFPGLKERNTIVWVPAEKNGDIIWTCKEGTMPDKNRPTECRGGEQANATTYSQTKKAPASSDLTKKMYSADKHVSIRVPESWAAKDLLPTAVIGAANLVDENYIVILEDTKADFEDGITLENYSENIQKQLMSNIKNGQIQGVPKDLQVAKMPAQQFVFMGTAEGIKIAYVVTLIETDKSFYRVLTWTMQSRFEKNKALLQNVSESIRFKK
jgi:TM2 domain-containing membrane protein YozV/Tfp pilus assembly protein PilE